MWISRSVLMGSMAIVVLAGVSALPQSAGADDRSSAMAQSPESGDNPTEQRASAGPTLQLVSSVVSEGNLEIVITHKHVLESAAVTVQCPGPNPCTVVASQQVQMQGDTTSGNRWSICSHVDGNHMTEPLCPYLGELPTDDAFDSRSFTQSQSNVSVGQHKVRSFVYVRHSGKVHSYLILYSVYSQG